MYWCDVVTWVLLCVRLSRRLRLLNLRFGLRCLGFDCCNLGWGGLLLCDRYCEGSAVLVLVGVVCYDVLTVVCFLAITVGLFGVCWEFCCLCYGFDC